MTNREVDNLHKDTNPELICRISINVVSLYYGIHIQTYESGQRRNLLYWNWKSRPV